MQHIGYVNFVMPGLIIMAAITEVVFNAAIGFFMPKESGAIYEILAAPISAAETVLGYAGASLTKALLLAVILLSNARVFVAYSILHPVGMVLVLFVTLATFSFFGLILGIWARAWQQLIAIPALVLTPLAFLGGTFYSIDMLPPEWRKLSLFNPMLYVVSAFRWSFYGKSAVDIGLCWIVILLILLTCLAVLWRIFKTGYRLRT
jgi:ABC-2 type transport system permease protein